MANNKSLKQKAVSGMIWTTVQRFAGMGISFISGIILARLLMPEDYGAIGMLTIFMLVAQAFLDGGFGAALIQKKQPTEEDYSTVFWFNLSMAIVLYVILFLSAPFISEYYHMPILRDVLRVQALVLIISALSIVQANQLNKQFKFKKIAIVTLFTSIVSLAVTVWMAYSGYGVWSLVVQGLLSSAIPSLIYWFTNKWHPKFTFSTSSFKELFSFGFFMFLMHVVNEICNNIQGLLIGRVYTADTMGYYSKARGTEKLASNTITQALKQVTFPLYAELQSDKERLITAIKKLTQVISFFTFPLMMLLILLAKPIFILLYSERWIDSIPYFQVLCLAGIPGCLQSVNLQAIAAIGKSKTSFSWTIIKRGLGIFLMIGGMYIWGIWGLLGGMVLSIWIMYMINIYIVDKYIGYGMGRQLLDLVPTFIISLFSYIISYLFGKMLGLGLYSDGMIQLVCFCVIYIVGAILLKLESFKYVSIKLMNFYNNRIKKKN